MMARSAMHSSLWVTAAFLTIVMAPQILRHFIMDQVMDIHARRGDMLDSLQQLLSLKSFNQN